MAKSASAEFEQGNLVEEGEIENSTKRKGTKVSFVPDESIFKNYKFRSEYVLKC